MLHVVGVAVGHLRVMEREHRALTTEIGRQTVFREAVLAVVKDHKGLALSVLRHAIGMTVVLR